MSSDNDMNGARKPSRRSADRPPRPSRRVQDEVALDTRPASGTEEQHGAVSSLPDALERWPHLRRFADRLQVDETTGCVLWTGRTDRDGYGIRREDGRDVRLHRWSWTEAHGRQIPADRVVRHHCDRPSCVCPDHLELGTPRDNVDDRQRRDRQAKGERNGRSMLQESQVSAAKRVLLDGAIPRARLARLLGVDPTTLRDIERGKIWGHVDPE